MKRYFAIITLLLFGSSLSAQNKKYRIQLVTNDSEPTISILVDGKPFTAYLFPSNSILKKPVLYPLLTAKGTSITRGYPLAVRTGERNEVVTFWLVYKMGSNNKIFLLT